MCEWVHLFKHQVKHEDEAAQVHVVVVAVQVQGAVSGGVAEVLEGAAAQGAPERTGKRTQVIVLPSPAGSDTTLTCGGNTSAVIIQLQKHTITQPNMRTQFPF